MRLDVNFKNMSSSEYLENVIAKDIEKLKKRITIYEDDSSIHLILHLEKNPHREEYFSNASLYLPQKVLKASQKAEEPALSVNKTTQALLRQIDKHKIMVDKHLQRKREISRRRYSGNS